MLKVDLQKTGEVRLSGSIDDILTEYTIVTHTLLYQLNLEHGQEKAFLILAKIGQIAARNLDQLKLEVQETYDEIYEMMDEVMKNEIQV